MLKLEKLSAQAFAAFGDVIEAGPDHARFPVNAGTSQRFHDLARLDPGDNGRLTVSIFRAQPRTLPFQIQMLERHPQGSQAFMPLNGRPFLVVVAPAAVQPAPAQIRAFLCTGKQGINFAPGVWHHPLLALQAESDFLVIDRDDPHNNCDEFMLTEALLLDMDASLEARPC